MHGTINSDERAATPRGTGAAKGTINGGTVSQSDLARQVDYEMNLWTDTIALMASTLMLAAKIEGKEVSAETIMNQAADFANHFMEKRAALLGGAK